MMKEIEFNNLPAGSVVLVKKYNLWQRLKAKVCGKELPYNDAWIDPFGNSSFTFKDTFWTRFNVDTFVPRKPYSKKEMLRIWDTVIVRAIITDGPVEALLKINLIRPDTLHGSTLEEMFLNNKYYNQSTLA